MLSAASAKTRAVAVSRRVVAMTAGGVKRRQNKIRQPVSSTATVTVAAVSPLAGSVAWYSSKPPSSSDGSSDGKVDADGSTSSSTTNPTPQQTIIPGASFSNQYGSLGDDPSMAMKGGDVTSLHATGGFGVGAGQQDAVAWQAEHNADVQRVTQNALIYELQQEQTKTIESVVPWFLKQMPASYFRQVPEQFRMDHIKAISAVKDANMDLYLNLKSHTHDGRFIYTFIRPGTAPGTLLSMVEELPHAEQHTHHENHSASRHSFGGAVVGDGEVGDGDYMPLTRLHVFSSLDGTMSLNMFVYGNKQQPKDAPVTMTMDSAPVQAITQMAQQVQDGTYHTLSTFDNGDKDGGGLPPHLQPNPMFEPEPLQRYLEKCSANYLNIISRHPERFLQQRLMFEQVSGTEGCHVQIAPATQHDEQHPTIAAAAGAEKKYFWIDVAVANSLPEVALEHTCRLLFLQELDVRRARLDVIDDDENGSVTMLRLLVTPTDDSTLYDNQDAINFDMLQHEIKRSKWLDNTTMDLAFDQYPWLGVRRGEILTAMCSLLHPVLAKDNPLVYSKHNILEMVTHPRRIGHASKIADLFLQRFDPDDTTLRNGEQGQALLQEKIAQIKREIDADVEDSTIAAVFHKMLDVVTHTLKTNIFMENRYALGFRLDPNIMMSPGVHPEVPHGILFVHGRRFNGYHVRFRDISRGGMRLVTPASAEQYALESARQFDECYGLAFAQQLKNKDIPEGGSKAVCLIDTNDLKQHSGSNKNFVMRKAVKAFTDTILDLVVQTPETQSQIVDYLGQPEILYLGPDEQVIPEDINWIIQQAARRGYPTPAAFMSSKPRAGINHKEFGVTSEGVNVYLDVALRRTLGIDPTKESFTVKMTGGPDGDVGGNEIKILIREYGDNVKIVGIADHSGCAEDPTGLDHDELLRLFREGLCISNFDATKLSSDSDAVLHMVDTEEGVKARNTMHNRLKADAFVPCGGRPNTIDTSNYRQFISEDGETPSSPLIVEGANLFVTADARKKLHEEAGVVIVKDSSANKGGVITSSYEICAAMLLSEEDFYQHKTQIVDEVLAKLRGLAKLEAELLFREAENYGGALPEVSQIISNSINAATDALSAALDELSREDRDELLPLFRAHLPQTLADLSFGAVHERVPDAYIKNAMASCLASKMVYKEGTKFIDAQPKHKLATTALRYIQKEKEVAKLMESLRRDGGSNATSLSNEEKEKILNLLDAGGARTALDLKER